MSVFAYRPKIADTVRIKGYTGMLHPNTIWVVKDTRADLALVVVPSMEGGHFGFIAEHWVDNSRLKKVLLPVSSDPDISRA